MLAETGNVTAFSCSDDQTKAILDLTPAYSQNATKITRSLLFLHNEEKLILQDEIIPNKNTKSFIWRLHTQSDIESIQVNHFPSFFNLCF